MRTGGELACFLGKYESLRPNQGLSSSKGNGVGVGENKADKSDKTKSTSRLNVERRTLWWGLR